MRRQITRRLVLLCAAIAVAALVGGPSRATAQHSTDASPLEAFGLELADMASDGDVEGLLARTTTSEYTCPEEPLLPQPACGGEPPGTVVEGYWIGALGTEFALRDRASFVERLSGDLGFGIFGGARVRLATVSGEGFGICAECSRLVLTSVPPGAAEVGSPMFTVAVRSTPDGLRIAAVSAGSLYHENQVAYLTGGQVGDATFRRVGSAPNPPETGSGTAERGNEPGTEQVPVLMGAIVVAVAVVLQLRRR